MMIWPPWLKKFGKTSGKRGTVGRAKHRDACGITYELHRPGRDRGLHRRLYLAGGLAGLTISGVEGLFPGGKQYPDLGRDDLDRRDRDEHRHVPERPRRGLPGRFHVPATGVRLPPRA